MKRTVKLVLKDVKKGSVRYDAAPDENDPIITNVYAMKGPLPSTDGAYPPALTVTVEWEG